jgi:hypothetical protein
MTAADSLDLIRTRRKVVDLEIGVLKEQIAARIAEQERLSIAEAVILQLSVQSDHNTVAPPPPPPEEDEDEDGFSKPNGIPTMPEMIFEALRKDKEEDILDLNAGLEPKEMMKFIAEKYWPDVRSELVGPIAWRMWKQGRLLKEGNRYRLPEPNEAPPLSRTGRSEAGE